MQALLQAGVSLKAYFENGFLRTKAVPAETADLLLKLAGIENHIDALQVILDIQQLIPAALAKHKLSLSLRRAALEDLISAVQKKSQELSASVLTVLICI